LSFSAIVWLIQQRCILSVSPAVVQMPRDDDARGG